MQCGIVFRIVILFLMSTKMCSFQYFTYPVGRDFQHLFFTYIYSKKSLYTTYIYQLHMENSCIISYVFMVLRYITSRYPTLFLLLIFYFFFIAYFNMNPVWRNIQYSKLMNINVPY